ncbi:MAG: low molecular weight protein tyrosine phosphatase family protein [Pleurocapsa sp.]
MTLNFLFVCSKNKWRSPTAETIYRHDSRIKVRSAGTRSSSRKRISENDLNWADIVLVMENKHKKIISNKYSYLDLPKIIVLDIPDDYKYMSDELINMLQTSVEKVLESIFF